MTYKVNRQIPKEEDANPRQDRPKSGPVSLATVKRHDEKFDRFLVFLVQ
jgi:hypothetical protein